MALCSDNGLEVLNIETQGPRQPRSTERDDGLWFRPVWESESAEDGLDLSGLPPGDRLTVVTGLDAPASLASLAEVSTTLARLDARLDAADLAVAEGLRARLVLREAAG